MNQEPIRIGLIGVSHRARIAQHWNNDGRAKIVAGADIDGEFLDKFKEEYEGNAPFVTRDYRELAARDDVDAVGVFSPDNLHHDHVVAALEAGKHVFTEKPMAISTEDCDHMIEVWRRSGKRFMVGMNMRYMDKFLALKRIIDSGQIGDVKAVWVRHFVGFGGWAYFHDYRVDHRRSTGLLLQKASHDIDMIHFLTGRYTRRVTAMGSLDYYGGDKPDDLTCETCPERETCSDVSDRKNKTQCVFRREVDIEDHSMVLMDLGDVHAAYLQCHYASSMNRNYLFIGTRGEAELADDTITVRTPKGQPWKSSPDAVFARATYDVAGAEGGHGGADPRVCKAFLDLVADDTPPRASPTDGRMCVAVGCAATESLRNGNVPIDISAPTEAS